MDKFTSISTRFQSDWYTARLVLQGGSDGKVGTMRLVGTTLLESSPAVQHCIGEVCCYIRGINISLKPILSFIPYVRLEWHDYPAKRSITRDGHLLHVQWLSCILHSWNISQTRWAAMIMYVISYTLRGWIAVETSSIWMVFFILRCMPWFRFLGRWGNGQLGAGSCTYLGSIFTEVDLTVILTGIDTSPAVERKSRFLPWKCSGFSSVMRITVIRL